MTERRSLIDGLKATDATRHQEAQFVRTGSTKPSAPMPAPSPGRVPLTTRLRADYAQALKRASLERQLAGAEPSTVQAILEAALGPWLSTNGYLS